MKRLALLVLLAGATPFFAQNTFHGNLARTGVYDSAGPAKFSGVKWTFKTGGPVVGSPAIAANTVYIGSLDGYLYAIDQETGKEKWKTKSRMGIASTPAIAGDTVYFVSSAGALGAIDAATGKMKWVFGDFQDMYIGFYRFVTIGAIFSSPAVDHGVVYFGSLDGNVYALQ